MSNPSDFAKPDIRLIDLFKDMWNAKTYIAIGICVCLLIGAVFLFVVTPHYKISMIVAPANPMNGNEVSSMLANDNLFALRFLAQRIGAGSSSDFVEFESIYNGPSVAGILLKDPNILKVLKEDLLTRWSSQRDGEINAEEFAEYLKDRVRLQPISGNGLRNLVYYHPNPNAGKYLIQEIHRKTDALIRNNIKAESLARADYLKNAVAQTSNPEHRRALTTLLLEQERLLMLVSIDQPYVASIVEPPSGSVKTLWPDYTLLIVILSFVGAFLGFLAYSFRGNQGIDNYKNLHKS